MRPPAHAFRLLGAAMPLNAGAYASDANLALAHRRELMLVAENVAAKEIWLTAVQELIVHARNKNEHYLIFAQARAEQV